MVSRGRFGAHPAAARVLAEAFLAVAQGDFLGLKTSVDREDDEHDQDPPFVKMINP